MRVKIILTGPSYAQTINLPCEGSDTVEQLKQKIRKRITTVPEDVTLIFDGGKLFDEDSLSSLGIKEGDIITEDNGNAGLPPPSVDLTVGDLTIHDNVQSGTKVDNNNNNNNNNTTTSTSTSSSATPPLSPSLSKSSSSSTSTPNPQDNDLKDNEIVIINPTRPLEEVIEVVFDISTSMEARFVDELSRLGSSKVCFGALIDKTLAYEYSHAIGLICFGQNIYDKLQITRQLNTFEAVFGDVIKTEGATNLYPAVDLAVRRIRAYSKDLPNYVKKRIMCFTDGGDNSGWSAYDVSKSVLGEGIIVDAIIIGGQDSDHQNLRSLAHSSGGISVRIPEQENALSSVFEREQILSLSTRIAKPILPKEKLTLQEFKSFGDLSRYPYVGVELKEISSNTNTKPTTVAKSITADKMQAMISASSTPSPSSATSTSSTTTTVPQRSPAASKRILKEYADMGSSAPQGTETYITENNISEWKCFLVGPPNTVYEGGIFVVQIEFPKDYPFAPPKVFFLTPIYHCNINDQGRVCLDILKDHWSPSLTIAKVLHSLQYLLVTPNADDALVAWKAALYRTDKNEYEKQAKEYTVSHAPHSPDEARQRYNLSL